MVASLRFWHNCAMRSEGTHGDDVPAPADASAGSRETHTGQPPAELGGPAGPEPTRYGDWEKNGRCIDF
jgi:hypothetical protein